MRIIRSRWYDDWGGDKRWLGVGLEEVGLREGEDVMLYFVIIIDDTEFG